MSVVLWIELISDRSQVYLFVNSLQFYPHHKTLLNIEESIRQQIISSGRKLFAFLPTRCFKSTMSAESDTFSGSVEQAYTRQKILTELQENIEYVLRPARDIARQGLRIRTWEGKHLPLHLLIAFYIWDMSETGDFFKVIRGWKKFFPWYICFETWEQVSGSTTAPKRTLQHTRCVSANFQNSSKNGEASDTFKKLSMDPIAPVLSGFIFAEILPRIDV